MAHPCSLCGMECYCNGDIDDCVVSLTPANCETCCCEDDDWREDDQDDDIAYNPHTDQNETVRAVPPEEICRQCGCHTYMACTHPELGACWWAEPATPQHGPLCSHCALELANQVDSAAIVRPWKDDSLAF